MARWSCAACMSIRRLDDRASPGRCSKRQKMDRRRCRVLLLTLSTSEIQEAAIALYKDAGYKLLHEETVDTPSNKTVGSGIRRYYFEKALG